MPHWTDLYTADELAEMGEAAHVTSLELADDARDPRTDGVPDLSTFQRADRCFLYVLARRAELWDQAERLQRLAGGFTGEELRMAEARADA